MNKYSPTTWGWFMSSISKRFVMSGAGQTLPSSLPAERRTCFLFLPLTDFYITAEYFLSFSSLLKLTVEDGKSAIIIFLSSFTSNHFSLISLVPVLLCIGTHGVSGTFTLCICRIYWWRHREGQEQNYLLVTNQGWKQPVLMIFLLNGSQQVEILLTMHRNYYFLPTSLFNFTGEKEYKMKLKMFGLSLERRWSCIIFHYYHLLPQR